MAEHQRAADRSVDGRSGPPRPGWRQVMAVVAAALLLWPPCQALAQHAVAPDVEAAALRQMAAGIPLGSRVKLQTTGGRRLTATLMAVSDEAVIVKRVSRVPEPAVTVPFSELARLQREEKGGFSLGKAIGIGLAAGAGAILTLFAIAVSIAD